jgi:hypothetical protein
MLMLYDVAGVPEVPAGDGLRHLLTIDVDLKVVTLSG